MLVYSLALSLTQYGGNVFFQNGGWLKMDYIVSHSWR
jgi:hypothetical protein